MRLTSRERGEPGPGGQSRPHDRGIPRRRGVGPSQAQAAPGTVAHPHRDRSIGSPAVVGELVDLHRQGGLARLAQQADKTYENRKSQQRPLLDAAGRERT